MIATSDTARMQQDTSHKSAARPLRVVFYTNCLGQGGAHHTFLAWFDLLSNPGDFTLQIWCHKEGWFTDQLKQRGLTYRLLPMPDALAQIRHGQWKNRWKTLWSGVTAVPRLISSWWKVGTISADLVVLTGGRDFIMLFPLVLRKRNQTITVPQTTDWGAIPTCRLMCKLASRTFAISKEVAASITSMGIPSEKVSVLPMIFTQGHEAKGWSRNSVRQELGLSGRGPVIAMAGVVRPHKGQLDAVRVVEELVPHEPGATLLIIGAPAPNATDAEEYFGRVRRYVEENHLAQNVKFLGWRSDLPRLLRGCDFMVVPSHDYEGVPRVILEGLEAGVPVLGSELAQFKDVLLDAGAGFLCPLGNPSAWSAKILELWNDRRAYENACKDSRNAWERYYSPEAARKRLLPALHSAARIN